jgi:hypothetical protein
VTTVGPGLSWPSGPKRTPLATVKPEPGKGDLDRRQRPNVKPSPKARELDREFLRWVGTGRERAFP